MKDAAYSLSLYHNVTQKFKDEHPDFFGARIIYSPVRFGSKSTINATVFEAISLRKQFPRDLLGYDLVSYEDEGHSLMYYLDSLLLPSQLGADLPFYFHAGETSLKMGPHMLHAAVMLSCPRCCGFLRLGRDSCRSESGRCSPPQHDSHRTRFRHHETPSSDEAGA